MTCDAFVCSSLSTLVLTTRSKLANLDEGTVVLAHIPNVFIKSERAVKLIIPSVGWHN